MNPNATKKAASYKVTTATGKIPHNVGFPSGKQSGGGVIRKLTKKELKQQSKWTNK